MDDQRDSAWADAMLRRPAVDPGIPGPERALLTAPGTLLTPACHARPARNRDYLPTDPDKRGATIDGAVMGMTAAAFIAVGGATPLAIGTLIFSDPVGWQSASGRYGLLLAEILAIITAVVFVTRIVRFGQPGGRAPADVAARTYHGRYLTAADFDAQSRVLLRRSPGPGRAARRGQHRCPGRRPGGLRRRSPRGRRRLPRLAGGRGAGRSQPAAPGHARPDRCGRARHRRDRHPVTADPHGPPGVPRTARLAPSYPAAEVKTRR